MPAAVVMRVLLAGVLLAGVLHGEDAAMRRIHLADDLAGDAPQVLGETTLELAGGQLRTPLELRGTLYVRAEGAERVLSGRITTGDSAPVPPQASFVAAALRGVTQDDWRVSQRIAGQRDDRLIHLPDNAWGTAAQRAAWGISGNDSDWEVIAVQYDGIIHVEGDSVDLATRSDDGSRMWLDRDGDGRIGAGEWGSNGWGNGQGATTRVVHRAVPRGQYRYRIQCEEGNGGNCLSLLWSDAQRSAGLLDDLHIVPEASFCHPAQVMLTNGPDLAIAATIAGHGGLSIDGPVATWLPGASCAGALRVRRGTLRLQADLDVPLLEVAAGATVQANGHRIRAEQVRLIGEVALAGGTLELHAALPSTIRDLPGRGNLRISGGAQVLIDAPGQTAIDLQHGRWRLAGNEALHAALPVRPALGADLPLALSERGPFTLSAEVEVPPDAPSDLGVLAYARDRHGSWHQQLWPHVLSPGRHHLRFAFDPEAAASPASGDPAWNADHAVRSERAGLHLWSVQGGGVVRISVAMRFGSGPIVKPPTRLLGLAHDGVQLRTGQRWELSCLPQPMPSDPYDPEAFALDAEFTGPDGQRERVAGFYLAPASASDGGDRVVMRFGGPPSFRLRWRPRQPGAWRCRLSARWRDGSSASSDIALQVEGPAWDGFLRVAGDDPRFLAVDGGFHWPIGINLHAVSDERAREVLGTKATPQRGIFAYDALLSRFGAAGADLVEVWMAAWNLGIEWGAHRPGFAGAGRYNQGNAAQLDALLDLAWARGMRVILAVNHLGQGSDWCAPEWLLHPFHRGNGGWLDRADDLFTDPRALAYQERYRRYVIARWGDHPAVACWKLWTEIDLTNMRGNTVAWHERASRRWRELDPYRHLITTHWCGTYRNADHTVLALPDIDFATIDAYHDGDPLADWLHRSTTDPEHGLQRTGKPVLVSEYGANWNGGTRDQLLAETASAPFVGLVSGHAGAPMCWWFERLDQDGWWDGFRAIRAFTAGEDLRGSQGRCIDLAVEGAAAGQVWAKAWQRPGRLLGYALDSAWGMRGGDVPERSGVRLLLPGSVTAGAIQLEWWDADRGTIIERRSFEHVGGTLALTCPTWRRHVAVKMWRAP